MSMMPMPRLPTPLTPQGLQGLMRERPYWDTSHPRSALYHRLVQRGFEILYPGPARYGARGTIDAPPLKPEYVTHLVAEANREMEELERGFDEKPSRADGEVHVQSHTRDGGKVEVSDHWRSAPGKGAGADIIDDLPKPRNLLEGPENAEDETNETSDAAGAENKEFFDRISKAEQSFDKPGGGYEERNPESNELGRYQMKPGTLEGIDWRNPDGTWTNKAREHGVASDADYLKNPEAQEAAAKDMLRQYQREAKGEGLYDHIGQKIEGKKAEIEVTEAGIIAATHAEGATGTRNYFEKIEKSDNRSKDVPLTDKEQRIETRLRIFQDVPYTRVRKQ